MSQLIGSASEVLDRLQALEDAGATDFAGAVFASNDDEYTTTLETLRDYASR